MEYHGSSGNDLIDQQKLSLPDGSIIYGEAGDDTIALTNGIAVGGAGNDTIRALGSWATAAYWGSPKGVEVDLKAGTAKDGYGTVDTLVNVRVVQGSSYDDLMIGSGADENFFGGTGNNTVIGGGGKDTVSYYFERSTAATIRYDAASDTFTINKNFIGGDYGTDILRGISLITFSGGGSDNAVIARSSFVGSFRPSSTSVGVVLPAGAFVSDFRTGEFNGDGITDLALVTQKGTGTGLAPSFILLGNGKGAYSDGSTTVFAAGSPQAITGGGRMLVADFNGDKISDIFQLDFGDDAPPFPGGKNHLYLSSPGSGKLNDLSATLAQGNALNHGGSTGDVNGDGYADVLSNTLNIGNVLYLNDTTGHFTSRPDLLPHALVSLGNRSVPLTYTFSGMVDVNADARVDLVLGTWDGSPDPASLVLLNDGRGNFSQTSPIVLPSSGVAGEIILDVKPIDLNGDNYADLMLSVTNGGAGDVFYRTPYIQLLVNDGTGHFRDETNSRLPQPKQADSGWYQVLSAVDFNRDGKMDILASTAGSAVDSVVYLNNGAGTFVREWATPYGERAQALDANDDGMSDIVVMSGTGSVTVFTNGLVNSHVYKANFGGDSLTGSAGSDTFLAATGSNFFDGRGGLDTLQITAPKTGSTVNRIGTDINFSQNGVAAILKDIERIAFSDISVALDIDGSAGQLYRIYQAAFARPADYAGLGYWIGVMDNGASLRAVAAGFTGSSEFVALYAKASTNRAIVDMFYHNILHRAGDTNGANYWTDVLDRKADNIAGVLLGFSESVENQAALIGVVGNGIVFTPYHG
jgi:hypothetical protein